MPLYPPMGSGGLALLDDATLADVLATLKTVGSINAPLTVLWELASANMNTTNDQSFVKNGTFASYILISARLIAPSTSLTTAAGGIYNAASKGGDALVANSQTYALATTATTSQGLTLTPSGGAIQTATPILSLTTPQGGAATARILLSGIALS